MILGLQNITKGFESRATSREGFVMLWISQIKYSEDCECSNRRIPSWDEDWLRQLIIEPYHSCHARVVLVCDVRGYLGNKVSPTFK